MEIMIAMQKERKRELSQLEIEIGVGAHSTSDLGFLKCNFVNGCEFCIEKRKVKYYS